MVSKETLNAVRENWSALNSQIKELSQGLDRMDELLAQIASNMGIIPIDTATRLLQDDFPKNQIRTLNDVVITMGKLSGDLTLQRNRYEKVKQELQGTLGVLKAAHRAMDKLTAG